MLLRARRSTRGRELRPNARLDQQAARAGKATHGDHGATSTLASAVCDPSATTGCGPVSPPAAVGILYEHGREHVDWSPAGSSRVGRRGH